MIHAYFAYGSNMNAARMRERGVGFTHAEGAVLAGHALAFDKRAGHRDDAGHANIHWRRDANVHGVLYRLAAPDEIARLDVFERTPVNYSREVYLLQPAGGGDPVPAWVYVANPAARRDGLRPEASYLAHLLAGAHLLPADYAMALRAVRCLDADADPNA